MLQESACLRATVIYMYCIRDGLRVRVRVSLRVLPLYWGPAALLIMHA